MENQHRKIKGYRELSASEIDLMNRIKDKGAELLALQAELAGSLSTAYAEKLNAAVKAQEGTGFSIYQGATDEAIEFRRFSDAEPERWANIGKTDIQTGLMAMVRAVAQPAGV
jgi:hypothetical protein